METCETCPFFVPSDPGGGEGKAPQPASNDGTCHANPPQVSVVMSVQKAPVTVANPTANGMVQVPAVITQWPVVTGSRDWCGEHPAFAEETEAEPEAET